MNCQVLAADNSSLCSHKPLLYHLFNSLCRLQGRGPYRIRLAAACKSDGLSNYTVKGTGSIREEILQVQLDRR